MKKLLYTFAFLAIPLFNYATHIVGGGFNVSWLGGDNYQITLRVLRDCRSGQAPFNNSAWSGIFDRVTHNKATEVELPLIKISKLQFVTPQCGGSTNECTEEGLYQKVVSLSSFIFTSNNGYYISWERCCRNNIISNINNPGGASTAFYAEFPRSSTRNSTPKYTNNPVTLVCTNNPFTYNLNFLDADGDSLVYSLTNPLNGNLSSGNPGGGGSGSARSGSYASINWLSGYSANYAVPGNPPLGIDSKTGDITMNPTIQGTYVASVLVKEFRNGLKIGEVRLELQFQVIQCTANNPPMILQTDIIDSLVSRSFFEVQVPNTICFDIKSTDEKDSLEMTISSSIYLTGIKNLPTVSKYVKGYKKIVNRFCWQMDCSLNAIGQAVFTVEVKDNGCPLPRISRSQFIVNIKPMALQLPPVFECLSVLKDKTILNWNDTNQSDLLKSYRIYRGINNSNFTLLTELDKSITTYTDNNTPNNGYSDYLNDLKNPINYTYFIKSVNQCNVGGVSSDTIGTLSSIPGILLNDSLNVLYSNDTFNVTIGTQLCFTIKTIDKGDSLEMRVRSDVFTNPNIKGNKPEIDTLTWGNDVVQTQLCWKPNCEMYASIPSRVAEFEIVVRDFNCPANNISKRKIWVKFNPMPEIGQTDLLCMTLSNDNETYIYYGDSTPFLDFGYYLIYRGINYQNFVLIDTIWNKNLRMYSDRNTPNNKNINYTYFMIGVNKCGLSGPSSDTLSTFEEIEFMPQKQKLFTVTVTPENKIKVAWRASTEKDFAKYYLYKAISSSNKNYEQVMVFENASDTLFIDENVNVLDHSYCYHLVMRDTCDNIGPNGKEACSILLKGISQKGGHDLMWNEYIGWDNGVRDYDVQRKYVFDKYRSLVFVNQNKYNDKQFEIDEGAYFYFVNALENYDDAGNPGIAESRSNEIFMFQNPNVYLPNAFTRNGDELNDFFNWQYSFVKDFDMKVYSRWGQLVFQTKNKKEFWDGKINGTSAQQEAYVYIITYTGWDNESYTKKGTLTLLD